MTWARCDVWLAYRMAIVCVINSCTCYLTCGATTALLPANAKASGLEIKPSPGLDSGEADVS